MTWLQTDTASRRTLYSWRMDDHSYDPYGTSVNHCMGICEALGALGYEHLIPSELEFRPSPLGWTLEGLDSSDENATWPDCEYAEMIEDGTITPEQAARAAAVLGRYLNFVRLAGRDY